MAGCDPGTLFGPTVEQGKGGVPHHDGTGVCKTENGFEMAKMLPLFQKAVKEAETMQEPESISVRCIADAPQ